MMVVVEFPLWNIVVDVASQKLGQLVGIIARVSAVFKVFGGEPAEEDALLRFAGFLQDPESIFCYI